MTGKRSAEEILADWRAVRTEYTALDAASPDRIQRLQKAADCATRTAALLEESARLDPMPGEIMHFAVGVAIYHHREHAKSMLKHLDQAKGDTR
jgi:hypothetical protein